MASDTVRAPRFAVVTDSTADIAPELARQLGVTVVPLALTIDGHTVADGTYTQAEFFERMRAAKELPTTSQPSVGALAEAFERALETADSVISLHISSRLSGSVEAARAAAERFGDRVHVFDSRNLSWGLAWQVVDAANAAREGLSAPEALARLDRTRERVKMLVGLDSLDNLRKGGRIGAVSALLGSLLHLKITMTVDEDGAFFPLGRSRGEKAGLEYTMDWVSRQMGSARAGRFAVGHGLSRERALRIAEIIRKRWDVTEMVVYDAGSVICTHTGTCWGVTVWPQD